MQQAIAWMTAFWRPIVKIRNSKSLSRLYKTCKKWLMFLNYLVDIRGEPFNTRGEGMVFLPNQISFSLPTRRYNIFFLSWDITDKLGIFQDMFKDLFNCETDMRGTVMCGHTVGYRVQAYALISTTKLITIYYSNKTLPQCCFNVRPTSATLAHYWTNIGGVYNVWGKSCPVNTHSGGQLFPNTRSIKVS